ncbi:hypothetical protein BDR26DRAFT_983778 [Obelidium mucronatum]|nr:hypothetical protein BDR26DRAFT_983778 [Obelidium mucronatum]
MLKTIAVAIYTLIKKLILWLTGIADEAISANLEQGEPLSFIDWPQGIQTVKPTQKELHDFETQVEPKMMKRTFRGMFAGFWISMTSPYKLHFGDDDIKVLLNKTYYSRMISSDNFTIDMRHHADLKTLPGFYMPSVLAHLHQDANNAIISLASLVINGIHVNPSDKLWNLAKIYFVQALSYEFLFADHSVIHENNGFLEAAVRKNLSDQNPLHWFLTGHFGYGLALADAILKLFHKHTSPGNPFALTVEGALTVFARGNKSVRHTQCFPEYVDTPANQALGKARDVIRQHVQDFFTQNVSEAHHWEEIRVVLTELSERVAWIPKDLGSKDVIVDVIARFIYEGTVVHSFDHIHLTKAVGDFGYVTRIRRPFDGVNDWKFHELFRPVDTFQRVVFRSVFSGEKHSTSIIDIKYDERVRLTEGKFQRDLKTLEQQFPDLIDLPNTPAFINI